jgi:transposase-like protein
MLLIGEYLKGERAMADLCREFGVSRKTAYKWVARYRTDGPAGLADRSRAPLSHPARLDSVVVEAVLQARREHPHWGARKILAWLLRKQPQFESPAVSTVSAIFAKYGLSRTRHARRRTPPYTDLIDVNYSCRLATTILAGSTSRFGWASATIASARVEASPFG